MKDALDVVMAWQLRNPSATDPAEAIEAVKKARESDSELPQRLASHFLKLTIPPFFPQTRSPSTLKVSQKTAPWKDSHNEYVLDLLRWSVETLDRKEIERNWHLMVPPILKMIDDPEALHKAKGCNLLRLLLQPLMHGQKSTEAPIGTSRQTPSTFLNRTGYHEVFASTLWPLFTYIPSLTPEADSVIIFHAVHEPLRCLAFLSTSGDDNRKFLDKLMREGIFAPLSHFTTPSTYPDLACEIMRQIPKITTLLGIETVKHLPSLIPLFTSILQDPFILTHRGLILAALEALQEVIGVAWPRVPGHRGSIALSLCILKQRCDEEDEKNGDGELEEVNRLMRDAAEQLDAVLSQSAISVEWDSEKRELVDAGEGLQGFFEESAKEKPVVRS